jgi:hypothetical protein
VKKVMRLSKSMTLLNVKMKKLKKLMIENHEKIPIQKPIG